MEALTACFKGLSPSDDDMFENDEEGDESRLTAVKIARSDARMMQLRQQCEQAITGVIQVWKGDSEIGEASRINEPRLMFSQSRLL